MTYQCNAMPEAAKYWLYQCVNSQSFKKAEDIVFGFLLKHTEDEGITKCAHWLRKFA